MDKDRSKDALFQPLYFDNDGKPRFVANKIVLALLATSSLDLNQIAGMGFSERDMMQFYQQIGYSVDGFAEIFEDASFDVMEFIDAYAAALGVAAGVH